MKSMADFTGLYQVSQTLKFELRPVGATVENLKASGLLEKDFKRAEDYPKVKEFLDGQHKKFLQKSLSGVGDIDWSPLKTALDEFHRDNSSRKKLEDCQKSLRKKVVDKFLKDDDYSKLTESTPSKLFKDIIKNDPDVISEVKTFERFACYFKGYQENRKNIYSADAQLTSAANRVVNENFTKFAAAVDIFQKCIFPRADLMREIEAYAELGGRDVAELLKVGSYNLFLAQSGIELFNGVISKINKVLNEYRQRHQEIPLRELPFLPTLYKQILSDRERAFVVKAFDDDKEVIDALRKFIDGSRQVKIRENEVDLFSGLRQIFAMLAKDSDLFVDGSELDRISKAVTGDWQTISGWRENFVLRNCHTKKEREKYCKQEVFNFADIEKWFDLHKEETGSDDFAWLDFWQGEETTKLFERETHLRQDVLRVLDESTDLQLRERKNDIEVIKDYLDTIQELLHVAKPLAVGSEYGGDLDLLGIISEHYAALAEVIPLYNQIRNYVTKKISETAKIKLMFDNPTLADGWDSNKERDNTAVIFIKDGEYFLGIMNPQRKVDFSKLVGEGHEPCYRKMVYKLLPGPNKMLPKVFFSQKNIGVFQPSDELLSNYKSGLHLKGENFDLRFCHELINFFKHSIAKHPDWSKFGFKFSDTSSYEGIDDFYREISDQGYIIKFADIPTTAVDKLVGEGKLFLFKIWNKDFNPGSTGTPNKTTLYWKALFDPQNLSDVVFKLNGEAELFFREAAIKEPSRHRVGEKLVNRTIVRSIVDGRAERVSIPEKIYSELFLYANGRSTAPLSAEAAEYWKNRLEWRPGMRFEDTLGKLVVKEAKVELVKDKRFCVEKFMFHVPITINFKGDGKTAKFNDRVKEYLRENPEVEVIGIDRGERNLIYLVLTDSRGRIIEQKSFNIVGGVDYHEKLDQREKERDSARKSWSEIGNIKDLKAGYLSGVIHEIAKLMVEHNAIVVMEDLNRGFTRGRNKIEKQVYQKFERALITKLNYLVFKDTADVKSPGGVMNGYQLTDKFESFAKMGKQSGFLFYVPAWCTSKIDPVTGFVDLFGGRYLKYESAKKVKEFFSRFDAIGYSAKDDFFEFSFDYKKFPGGIEGGRAQWVVCSFGERLENSRTANGQWETKKVDPTAELKKLFAGQGIAIDRAILPQLLNVATENAGFWKDLLRFFRLVLQMRNSRANSTAAEDDYIISPVRCDGVFFDSRRASRELPTDADANGAYNIARKGILLLENIRAGRNCKMTSQDWLDFAQTREG